MKRLALSLALVIYLIASSSAETVDVKYRGVIDLSHFSCRPISRSSFIKHVCHDATNAYMIVMLKDTYYHYCDVDNATHDEFMNADSIGGYFNASIKGQGAFRL